MSTLIGIICLGQGIVPSKAKYTFKGIKQEKGQDTIFLSIDKHYIYKGVKYKKLIRSNIFNFSNDSCSSRTDLYLLDDKNDTLFLRDVEIIKEYE